MDRTPTAYQPALAGGGGYAPNNLREDLDVWLLAKEGDEVSDDDDVLPLKVLVPTSAAGPFEVVVEYTALRLAVVDRPRVRSLGESWEIPGAYLLLDRPDVEGRWGGYVGKASPGKVRSRVLEHLRGKPHWYRAVLIRRDTQDGFHSAQAGWLEGRLYDLLDACPHIHLHNGNRPSDMTLPRHEQLALETCVEPIISLLHVLGHETALPPSGNRTPRRRAAAPRDDIGVVDLISAGLLHPGQKILSRSRVHPGHAQITAEGGIDYQGHVCESLSYAAKKLCGKGSWNGWDFWQVETEAGLVSLSVVRDRLRERRQVNGSG